MKLNHIVAALALAVAGTAFAAPTNIGTLDPTSFNSSADFGRTFSFFDSYGSFTDHFSFTLSKDASASGSSSVYDFGSFLNVDLTSISLSGGSLASAITDASPSSFSFGNLKAGTYFVDIAGKLSGQFGFVPVASYSVSLRTAAASVGAPVPEPEHYSMMFAGLVGLAWLVKRRQAA